MKTKLLLLVFLISTSFSNASHLMGGQMTSRNIGGLTYEVTLTVYRDVTGVLIAPTVDFHFEEVGGAWTIINSVAVSPAFNFGNGVEEYTYVTVVTFPQSGSFNLWYEDCCRNGALLNVSPNEAFHLYNNLWADSTNSSPVFLNPPITLAQLNVPFNYNPLPFDIDGDSIVWSVDTPKTYSGASVAGFMVPSSSPLGQFTMNSMTGEVSFLPNLAGYFEASFLVSEYRNGNKIGEIRRDMQIIVLNSPNAPPSLSAISNTFPYSGKQYNISSGSNFSLTMTVADPDSLGINVTASGEPLVLVSNAAIYTYSSTGNGAATATLNWTPDISQNRIAPYLLTMRISENYSSYIFQNDISFSLRVGNFTGIESIKDNAIKSIYPNPNNGAFTLEYKSEKNQYVLLSISNIIGQHIKSLNYNLIKGVNLINVRNMNLPSGKYILSVSNESKQSDTETFEVK